VNILLDHCVPRPLRREFPGHDITTTREMGWEALKNGALLDVAQAAGFVVLLTVDQNLRYQQNLQGGAIAVVVMIAGGITVEDLRPLVPAVEQTLLQIQTGQLYEVRAEPLQE
jgi:predicted nuclease of predicted toxin-antitoxin system